MPKPTPKSQEEPQGESSEDLENIFKELKKHYDLILKQILDPKNLDESGVLFLGKTGHGKTTLLTGLDGVALKGVKDEDDIRHRLILEADKDPENLQGISGGFNSGTRKATNHQKYWDLPGILEDTDGDLQEILNSLWISGLFPRLKKIRIAIVISEDCLAGRYMEFREVLRVVGEMFCDIDQQTSSVCLIVTKCENSDPDPRGLCKILSKFLDDQKKNLNQQQSKLLKYFAETPNAIAYFLRPPQEGLVTSDIGQKKIIEAIEGLPQWYENPRISPCPGLSPKAKQLLSKLKDLEMEKFFKFLKEHFDRPRIWSWIKTILDDPRGGSAVFLRTAIKGLREKIASLLASSWTLDQALHLLKDICHDLKDDRLSKLLEEKIKPLEFLGQIDSDTSPLISNVVSERFSFFIPVCEELSDLIEIPQPFYTGKILSLSGKIINSGEINTALQKHPGISEVDVYSYIVIYLDGNTKAPGVTMSLLSPHVQVEGTPSINLAGMAARGHLETKAVNGQAAIDDPTSTSIRSLGLKAQNGGDGLPGWPGQNGGNLFVKTGNFRNSDKLSIDVSGGHGSSGQNGGDGANGVDGKEGDSRERVEKRDESAIFSKTKLRGNFFMRILHAFLTFNSNTLICYQAYEAGQEGGNAGSGGKGGCGGNQGEIEIGGAALMNKAQNLGDDGLNGASGKPGIGGLSGPVYRGACVEERIFGNFRDLKKSDILALIRGEFKKAPITTLGLAGLNISHLIATGILPKTVLKGTFSVLSKIFGKDWERKPYIKSRRIRARNGNYPTNLNTQGRKRSEPAQEINQAEKWQNYKVKLGGKRSDSIISLANGGFGIGRQGQESI